MERYRIGVDVGGTKIAYGLFDSADRLLERRRVATQNEATQQEFVDIVSREVRSLMQAHGLTDGQMEGVALCFPASVDAARGVVVFTPTIPSLQNFPAAQMFARSLPGLRLLVDNDTNAAALAEYRCGAGRGYPHMLFTTVSTGIGTGLILDGRLYRGAYGGAGESGHMIIQPDAQECWCGCGNKGCFMGQASGGCVGLRLGETLRRSDEDTLLRKLAGNAKKVPFQLVKQAYAQGDPLAVRTVQEMGRTIGLLMFNCFCLLGCNCYVLGGGVFHDAPYLLKMVRKTFADYSARLLAPGDTVVITTAQTGDDMGIIGAAQLLRGPE